MEWKGMDGREPDRTWNGPLQGLPANKLDESIKKTPSSKEYRF